VVAVAIAAKTPTIVTFNLGHFPAKTLSSFGIEAVHPDDFAKSLFDANPEAFLAITERHRNSLRNPPFTAYDYLRNLTACGLPNTVEAIRTHNKSPLS